MQVERLRIIIHEVCGLMIIQDSGLVLHYFS